MQGQYELSENPGSDFESRARNLWYGVLLRLVPTSQLITEVVHGTLNTVVYCARRAVWLMGKIN